MPPFNVLLLLLSPLLCKAQLQWRNLVTTSKSTGPEPRRDCAIGFDSIHNNIYIYGGRAKSGNLDDTWRFNLTSATWQQLNTSATSPGKRFSVVSGVWGDGFYVSTGEQQSTKGTKFFNDVWRLDLTTLAWKELESGSNAPEKRYGAAGGFYQQGKSSFLYVTHGFSGERYSNTFRYDVSKSNSWQEVFAGTHSYNPNYPHARCLHSATMVSEHELVMYGGCLGGGGTGGPCPADDSWRFDQKADTWKRLPHCASPRTYSSMALLPVDQDAANKSIVRVVLYGGKETSKSVISVTKADRNEVVIFNTETDEWRKKLINGSAPVKRFGAAMVTVSDGIIMFGGSAESGGDQNDVWLLQGTSKMADATADGATCNDFYFTFIELHGIFMFIGWGILLQLGMFFARYFRNKDPWWFKMHRGFQVSGLIIGLLGFIFAIISVPFDHFKFAHGTIGLLIMFVGLLQPLNAFFRPHKTDPPTLKRRIWEVYHINAGRLALVFALINISLGCFLAVIPSTSWITWFVILALWVIFVVIMEIRLQVSRHKSREHDVPHHEMAANT